MNQNDTQLNIYRDISNKIKKILVSFYTQNIYDNQKRLIALIDDLNEICSFICESESGQYNEILSLILNAIERKDDILTADYLAGLLLPFIDGLIKNEINKGNYEVPLYEKDDLRVEYASNGEFTLFFKGIYFHSNNNPKESGQLLAEYWDNPYERICFVWGVGLGYHILGLLEMDPYRKIYVFEPEKRIIEVCRAYGVLNTEEKKGRVEIVYDPIGNLCAKYMSNNIESRLLIHLPTLEVMPENSLKETLKRYYISFISSINQKRSYEISFRENRITDYLGISDLKFNTKAQKAIIVSAGPSLDKNYSLLKYKTEDVVIIATAQTLRKLYRSEIVPDCGVISDTSSELKKLNEGIEPINCPLVFSSTASVPYVRDYKGPKYIFCQKGFEPAEKLAKEKGWPIIDSYGGSVALVSLALAIYKGFKEIIFVGQDLCYKGNVLHAEGTSERFIINEPNMENDVDIFGTPVVVPLSFSMFKRQIESVIELHPQIKFFNATEGGVHINGTKDILLSDIIKKHEGLYAE